MDNFGTAAGDVMPEWTLGDRLRKVRRDHLGGMDQARMAALLGVPRERYAQWERGGGNPRLSEARRIAELLHAEAGVPVAWTLGLEQRSSGERSAA